MSSKRLFLGVGLSSQAIELLTGLQSLAKRRDSEGVLRWVAARNLHVTLHFLGDTEEGSIPALVERIQPPLEAVAGDRISLAAAGAFPSSRKPRVLWVDIHDPAGILRRLHEMLRSPLEELGFSLDSRRYHPHVTVGYARKRAQPRALAGAYGEFLAAAAETLTNGSAVVPVRRVDLVESTLTPEGPRYRRIFQAELRR